ncbi:MAG TPA: hypothetical protein VK626_01240, partial [Nitrospiraceae bacterium]|nr:hypothetical protein [Nitrospiraceae bacterium]
MARLLTRPTLARRDVPCPKQGRSSTAHPRFSFHASRFTVPGSDVRTKLAGFFSILLADWCLYPTKSISGKKYPISNLAVSDESGPCTALN